MQEFHWVPKKTMKRNITYLGRINFRNQNLRFGIKENDRFSHTLVVGKTGVGKTTLLKNQIKQDIQNGNGIAVFDPHGDLAEEIFTFTKSVRSKDLIYFDMSDPTARLRYNPLKRVSVDKRPLVASGLLETLKKQFGQDSWGVGMEHILRNCILTLLDQPSSDISDILRLLNDKDFRNQCQFQINNESVREFWTQEFNKYPPFTRQAAIRPIQNKIGAYLSNPVTKRILVENDEEISFGKCMDEEKVIIVNLSKGRIGADAACLLGGLFLTSIGLSGFARQAQQESDRVPFFVYADEFQNYTTDFLVNALSELRKYRVGMILAQQYLKQSQQVVREAVLGNVGTLIVFRVGVTDATYFSKEFDGVFTVGDISHLPNFRMYVRLMIDGVSSKGFSADI